MIIFEATGQQLKEMMKPLSVIADEARITFNISSMKSKVADNGNITMMNYELPYGVFKSYSLSSEDISKQIGIEFQLWYRIVNKIDKKEICIVSITSEVTGLKADDKNLESFTINIESQDGFSWSIPCIDPASIRKEPQIPDGICKHLVSNFSLPTKRFQKIFNRSFSEYIVFETTDSEFKTCSKGDFTDKQKSTTEIKKSENIINPAKTLLNKEYLLDLSKIIKSDSIQIHLGTDFLVQIDFSVLGMGSASFLLAPRVERE